MSPEIRPRRETGGASPAERRSYCVKAPYDEISRSNGSFAIGETMSEQRHHIAQLNISRLAAPLDAPSMKEFVDFLEPVNKFAEESSGFVWRMKGENGEASSLMASPFEDPMIVTNLTVWTDIPSLQAFVYKSVHRYFLQNRKQWFSRVESNQLVMWWVPPGTIPTLQEAKEKLAQLDANGPSAEAFTFQNAFDPAGSTLVVPRQSKHEG